MADSDHFSIANIPYGVASDEFHSKSVATRLEDKVFFLADLDLNYSSDIKTAISQVGGTSHFFENTTAKEL